MDVPVHVSFMIGQLCEWVGGGRTSNERYMYTGPVSYHINLIILMMVWYLAHTLF